MLPFGTYGLYPGNSGTTPQYSGVIFTGRGVLGPVLGEVLDNGNFYLQFFDAAAVPADATQCTYFYGRVVGPQPIMIPDLNLIFTNGCVWALSSTNPLKTIVSGSQGVVLTWQRTPLHG